WRVGYVNQFDRSDKERDVTVWGYLSEPFVRNQAEQDEVCALMADAEDLEPLLDRYQSLLDAFAAMDGDNYESNIRRQLKLAGLGHLEDVPVSALSGGEYKLLQVIREMLNQPELLVMDEPDVFLDFENLNGLVGVINAYKGTILAVTHNRYLLHHCFNKILHLEDTDVQEFDGNYISYNFALLLRKIELQEQATKEEAEIERTRELVERLRDDATEVDSATRGRFLHAKVSQLARLEARRIKAPFVEIRQPVVHLPDVVAAAPEVEDRNVMLRVQDYTVAFDELLLENVNFELREGEKVAIVGPNGTGKTTLLREIYKNNNPYITINDGVEVGLLSQLHSEMLTESNTVLEEFFELGFPDREAIEKHLNKYCFNPDHLDSRIRYLSGGEKNLLQLAKIDVTKANLLLLDEPTSHLDTYAQIALEEAVQDYRGAVLMVSHDFYNIVNCADYVLYVEDKTIRRMHIRTFRKKIYANHFSKDYLELELKKKELETRIARYLKDADYAAAKALTDDLAEIIDQMNRIQ
ncbi:MAG: ABC-F family ATP-binding cassette domain-containing protein, partial [Oscillospiraceae bacterium]|nr:ABC-F family ATP-binding cassette domain-containing protein [Oscillospiraceae bacterium]